MGRTDRSSRIIIHNRLAADACLQNAALEDSLLLSPPQSTLSLPPSRAPSGTTTPREVRVDSKERLSEMAINIRGISTALSKVSIALQVMSIVIITKLSDEALPAKAGEVTEWLLSTEFGRDEGLSVAVQDVFKWRPAFDYEGMKKRHPDIDERLTFWTPEVLSREPDKYDMAITLGGDGTVLFTSWLFQRVVPPVLSFSLGSLSFMTEHKYGHFQRTIEGVLRNGISAALRMRFSCTVMRTLNPTKVGQNDLRDEIAAAGTEGSFLTHRRDDTYVILNDVVVDRGPNPVMTMTELFGNFEFLTTISADGVVISTPSGSTAYSMSAGGPLAHPDIPATLVTPICPHSLSFRPLVLPDSLCLQIGVPYDSRHSAFASFDGKVRIELQRGDFLIVNASQYPFPKIIPPSFTSSTWVQHLSEGLHWNEQRRPKRFTQ